jgi:hypothetical protein
MPVKGKENTMASPAKRIKNPKHDKRGSMRAVPGKATTVVPRDQDGQPNHGSPAGAQTLPQAVGARQSDRGGKK